MSDVLQDFFNNQSEEEQKKRQDAVNKASSEGGSIPLKVSGTYLMEVGTYAFPDKETKKMRTSPELKVSEKKGSLMLVISLRVADEVPGVPKGASILTNIVLSPATGANQETLDNTMRLMKPRIAALTGQKSISVTSEWIEEWLIPKFEEKDGSYTMVKDHKMKEKVMVVVEDDIYNDKPVLSVKQIMKAQPGDKSVPNEVTRDEEPAQEMKAPSQSEFSEEEISGAVDGGSDSPTEGDGEIPETSNLPDDF